MVMDQVSVVSMMILRRVMRLMMHRFVAETGRVKFAFLYNLLTFCDSGAPHSHDSLRYNPAGTMTKTFAVGEVGEAFQDFGALLRYLRRRARLTQQQLGIAVGYSTPQISLLENGHRQPDLTTLAALFVPALGLHDEPGTVARLLQLAATARGAPGSVTVTRTVRRKVVMTELVEEEDLPEPAVLTRLPAPALPLIGRERDLAAGLAALLNPAVRLLTLIGPPGVGKTRLALQMGWDARDCFSHGVRLVELASTQDAALVPGALAQSLGVAAIGAELNAVLQLLRDKQALLVLDNFEQVLAAAPVVGELLAGAPQLKLLVTSREPLRLYGEHEYPVAPLALPDLAHLPPVSELEQSPAVALFMARAQAVAPGFRLTSSNALAVAAICARLDGLPLAIELAAAQIRWFAPHELAAHLIGSTNAPANRLPLAQRARNLPARHHTLRAAIDWSYNLLQPEEQRLFARLGVFLGGFDLDSAQAVSSFTNYQLLLPLLQSLLDKSLIQPTPTSGDRPRYRLLELLREYALERLAANGEAPAARRAHAGYFLRLAEDAEREQQARATREAHGTGAQDWLARLERDHDNLRAALAWLTEFDGEAALRLAGALQPFWTTRGYYAEGRASIQAALDCAGCETLSRAKALVAAATLAQQQGDSADAARLAEQALDIYRRLDDRPGIARALRAQGWSLYGSHDRARAVGIFEQALGLFRELGDRPNVAALLTELAHVLYQPGVNDDLAREYLGESLAIFRELGWQEGIANALVEQGVVESKAGNPAAAGVLFAEALGLQQQLGNKRSVAWVQAALGEAAWQQGRLAEARAWCETALRAFEELGVKEGTAILCHHLGHVERLAGNPALAAPLYRRSLRLAQEQSNTHMIARCAAGLGGVALAQGRAERAAVLLAAAFRLFEQLPPFLPPADRAEYEQLIHAAQSQLGGAAFTKSHATGRALTQPQLIRRAFNEL
jgi:predicted ATPase/transcriptional regulator with XRE-family HTH domain